MHGEELSPSGGMRPEADAECADGADGPGPVQHTVPGDGGRAVWPGDARHHGELPPAAGNDADSGPVSGGGLGASGRGGADGGTFGPISGSRCDGRPGFDAHVPDNGYIWWYVDALSDDGQHGLTIIGFVGSVFSPWYAWARRRRTTSPENHVAMNVVLYGKAGKRWAMTERGRGALERDATNLRIGHSAMHWDGDALTVTVDEVTAPIPSRIRGTVRVVPGAIGRKVVSLDKAGRHKWSPIAPSARVEVALERPQRGWSGNGYFDSNWGTRPLEQDFAGWHWCRAPVHDGTVILYNVTNCDGTRDAIALHYDSQGTARSFPPPPERSLGTSFWRLQRQTGAETGHDARLLDTLEDSPFYARSVVATHLLGQDVTAMHEQLSLSRFDTPWMRLMLPFKAPRWG
jgi:carotenoid 1,2-hydratase